MTEKSLQKQNSTDVKARSLWGDAPMQHPVAHVKLYKGIQRKAHRGKQHHQK